VRLACRDHNPEPAVVLGTRAPEERTIVVAADIRPLRAVVTPIAIEQAFKGTDAAEIFLRFPGDEPPLPVGQPGGFAQAIRSR